jgi:urease accessory protein UreH
MPDATTQYQELHKTGQMILTAAQKGNWADVERLEQLAALQIEAIQSVQKLFQMSEQERHARVLMLKTLLKLDAQVRQLAEPAWQQVNQWMPKPFSSQSDTQVVAKRADTKLK